MGFSKIVALLMTFVLVAAACGGDDETGQTGEPTTAATATTIPEDQPTAAAEESEPEATGDDEVPVPAEQASPEAVVAAYFEAADARDLRAMFALISPDIREGFTLAGFTECVSEQLDSGVDVAFEHSDTYIEGGSTFVEAVITLSEQGEGAVPSDDSESVAFPVVIEVVEIDGLWWAAGDKGGDAIFSCAREGIDETGPAGSDESEPICTGDECEDDRGPVIDEEWRVDLNDEGVGIHTVLMIKTFSPLEEADIEDLGGRLVWEEAEVELCAIGIRSVGDGFVQIGDIFQTTEGCGPSTGMQQTFDEFGPPETACLYVRTDGVDDEYCAPLTVQDVEQDRALAQQVLLSPADLGEGWSRQPRDEDDPAVDAVVRQVLDANPECAAWLELEQTTGGRGLIDLLGVVFVRVESDELVLEPGLISEVEHDVLVFPTSGAASEAFDRLDEIGAMDCIEVAWGQMAQALFDAQDSGIVVTDFTAVQRQPGLGDRSFAVRSDMTLRAADGTAAAMTVDVSAISIDRVISFLFISVFDDEIEDIDTIVVVSSEKVDAAF